MNQRFKKEVLDEAKVEFPDIKRSLEYPQNSLVLTRDDYAKIVKLFYDWKEKWLGR
jgi:hypothetical protein